MIDCEYVYRYVTNYNDDHKNIIINKLVIYLNCDFSKTFQKNYSKKNIILRNEYLAPESMFEVSE